MTGTTASGASYRFTATGITSSSARACERLSVTAEYAHVAHTNGQQWQRDHALSGYWDLDCR